MVECGGCGIDCVGTRCGECKRRDDQFITHILLFLVLLALLAGVIA